MQSEMQASLKNKPGFTVLLRLGTCTNCAQYLYLIQSRCENVLFCYVHLMSDEGNIWRGLRLMETCVFGVHDQKTDQAIPVYLKTLRVVMTSEENTVFMGLQHELFTHYSYNTGGI